MEPVPPDFVAGDPYRVAPFLVRLTYFHGPVTQGQRPAGRPDADIREYPLQHEPFCLLRDISDGSVDPVVEEFAVPQYRRFPVKIILVRSARQIELRPPPDPDIGGSLAGWFDFDLTRGQGAQIFP